MESKQMSMKKKIMEAMEQIHTGGDSYTDMNTLYNYCKRGISWADFTQCVHVLICVGKLYRDRDRISLYQITDFEHQTAKALSDILISNVTEPICAQPPYEVDGITLTDEQRRAIELVSTSRLSIILGGAGTGKSTLVSALMRAYGKNDDSVVLAAPTGKAAGVLATKAHHDASTAHSLLGLGSETDAFEGSLSRAGLLVLDEAGMMSTEMLSAALTQANEDCHIVLIGDPNQLPSVWVGNVIPDLLKLGVPSVTLGTCHRQIETQSHLSWDVTHFSQTTNIRDFRINDESIQLWEVPESEICDTISSEAAKRYLAGEDFQLLGLYNDRGIASIEAMNRRLQLAVNPHQESDAHLVVGNTRMYDGDRILVTRNYRNLSCHNGDGAILRLQPEEDDRAIAALDLDTGHIAYIHNEEQILNLQLRLGYAMTVHKVQGSEFDSIILPLSESNKPALTRNLLYTAITRARRQVILVGSRAMLEHAIRTPARPRKSTVVERTQNFLAGLYEAA